MTERRHPPEFDVQTHVDRGDVSADVAEHLRSCLACQQLAATMRRTAPAEPADGDTIEGLVSAAAEHAAPAALLAVFTAEPPEPLAGQVWQVLWETNVVLALLADVATDTVTVWPSTLDLRIADATALVYDATHTALAAPLVCWPDYATTVGSFTLLTCIAPRSDVDMVAVVAAWRTSTALPPRWGVGPARDVDHPCWRASAELADVAASVAAASWRDPAWDHDDSDEVPPSLADLLAERGLAATWLAETLNVAPRHAIALCRGSRALTDDQQARLNEALGVTTAPAQRPDPAVLDALDRPALRGMIRAVAAAEGDDDEVRVRRSFVGFHAAARQVDERDYRDVAAQVRVELARRLDAARGQGGWV